jgi:hypothetical protein
MLRSGRTQVRTVDIERLSVQHRLRPNTVPLKRRENCRYITRDQKMEDSSETSLECACDQLLGEDYLDFDEESIPWILNQIDFLPTTNMRMMK